jgi:hypothetical protein
MAIDGVDRTGRPGSRVASWCMAVKKRTDDAAAPPSRPAEGLPGMSGSASLGTHVYIRRVQLAFHLYCTVPHWSVHRVNRPHWSVHRVNRARAASSRLA